MASKDSTKVAAAAGDGESPGGATVEDKPEVTAGQEEGEEAKEAEPESKEEAEAPKEPEKPKELEEDAADPAGPTLDAGVAAISTTDSTLNVLPVANGKLLCALSEGGCQYLLAGARGTVGIKTGRYMFEVRIIESLNPSEPAQGSQGRTPQLRQLVRVGISAAGTSLFLSDGPDSVCFDSEGYFVYERNRKKVAQKFTRDQTVALLVNLDPGSPNANTISLFKNGVRISEPQAIPETLRGKVLYPAVTYKNVTLQVIFGPCAHTPLPFKCHMIGNAAKADVEIARVVKPKDGKYEVVLPVGLPEQGFFDWVDSFLEKHPEYVELSDRKILEWASKSSLWRPKGQTGTGSNDKPDMKFGIPLMDDMSVRKVLAAIAPTQERSYIIPELKSNLLSTDRMEWLARFSSPGFKKTATVIMGEPSPDYKEKVQALILADKRAKVEAEKKKKAQEEERKRLLEEKRKKAEEARKAKEAAQKRKEGKEVMEEKNEEEPKEKGEDPKMEEDAPLELTAEEKALWYRKSDIADLDEPALAKSYASFSLPTAEETFDSITYAWQDEATASGLLKKWILERKMVQRVEDLQPGAAFKEKWSKWQKALQDWRKLQNDYKDPVKRKAILSKKKEEAKKKKAEDGAEGDEKAEEPKPMDINPEDVDVWTVEDVTDIGNGEPVFQNFAYEDWCLLSARYEFHLLLHSFKNDLNDPDRPSFTEEHMPFYYNKYFKKTFHLKTYGVEKFADFVEFIKESLAISDNRSFLKAMNEDEDAPITNFVKLTEDHRRERQRRIDAGDETAKLKFTPPPPRQPQNTQSGSSKYGSSGGGSSSYKGSGSGGHSAAKRPYTPSGNPAYGTAAKQPRTAYSGGSSYGGGSSYYRRR